MGGISEEALTKGLHLSVQRGQGPMERVGSGGEGNGMKRKN